MTKKFSWSWSKLKNYRTCPKRHYHVDLAKDYREEEGEQLLWGNRVHKAMADRVAKGTALPRDMTHYDGWPQRITALRDKGMQVLVEQKLGMSKDFGPTSFFDQATWFRAVADVLVLAPQFAMAFDWKTGQVKPDLEQLALSAQVVFAHHPEIARVSGTFVWLGNDDAYTERTYERGSMVPLWNGLWPEITAMEEAHRTLTYPPKPSGICVRWCPVTSCPHHGKGTR